MAYPAKFHSPEEMQEKIDAYFENCEGRVMTDEDGKPIFDKFGHPVMVDVKPLTVTGLALALGFTNRVSLLNYQHKTKRYQEIIERAKLRIENYAEMRLYDKEGSNGARFNLQNNFRNWDAERAREEAGHGPAIQIICDIPKPETPPDLPNIANMTLDLQALAAIQKQATGETEAADEPDG